MRKEAPPPGDPDGQRCMIGYNAGGVSVTPDHRWIRQGTIRSAKERKGICKMQRVTVGVMLHAACRRRIIIPGDNDPAI